MLSAVPVFAYEDFIMSNYGFATADGFNFYVDETGYMVLKEGLEVKRIYVNSYPAGGEVGDPLIAKSNLEIWYNGNTFEVSGTGQVDTMFDIYNAANEINLLVKDAAVFKNGAPSVPGVPGNPMLPGKNGMRLRNGQDAQGPMFISFIKFGNTWVEKTRTPL